MSNDQRTILKCLVTARVRSTTGRYCFHRCFSVHRGGGYPYPIMLCNISQNAMGQRGGGGVPDRVPPWGGGTWPGKAQESTPPGGYLTGYPPGGVPDWVPPPGVPDRVPPGGGYLTGYPPRGGTWPGTPQGVPDRVPPRGGTWPGTPQGVPDRVPPRGGYLTGYPPRGVPDWVPPGGVPDRVPPWGGTWLGTPPGGGYPGRTTEGVLTTRRAVCLLRSRRRTFSFYLCSGWGS